MTKHKTILAACALALALPSAAQEMPGKGITIRPAEGTNIEEKFQHRIVYRALEELGYAVAEPSETSYQLIHVAIGGGDADFTAVHWDPLHTAFYDESGGGERIAKVGSLVEGALQGYLVDKKSFDAGITNLGDLKKPEVAKHFDATGNGKADLVGCPPGWGCEKVITHQVEEFGLGDTVDQNQGEYAAIVGDAIARFKSGEPIIYYTWTPYWVSGVLVPGRDVEWIEVPYSSLPDGRTADTTYNGKQVGFEVNALRIVANSDFLRDNPAAEKLFELASIDINDVSAQNNKMRDGEDKDADINRHVDEWIAKNRATFDGWIKAARTAG
ncbi:MAG: glycine betaine/L-proline ABC transporter substrate-binding protein ProX [Gammaproteobacteria bacterium]